VQVLEHFVGDFWLYLGGLPRLLESLGESALEASRFSRQNVGTVAAPDES